MGVYPFMFGATADFQPVVDTIVSKGLRRPYDWDEYAQCFFPGAEALVGRAQVAEREGNREKAAELYLWVPLSPLKCLPTSPACLLGT